MLHDYGEADKKLEAGISLLFFQNLLFDEESVGSGLSSERLSKWYVKIEGPGYELSGNEPAHFKSHSVRVVPVGGQCLDECLCLFRADVADGNIAYDKVIFANADLEFVSRQSQNEKLYDLTESGVLKPVAIETVSKVVRSYGNGRRQTFRRWKRTVNMMVRRSMQSEMVRVNLGWLTV